MLPFFYGFVGALAALALLRLVRFRRWRRVARLGPPRFVLRGLFRRLGARPEQEALLTGEADALAAELRALRQEGQALRQELAGLLDTPALDRAALDAAFERRAERLRALRLRASEAVTRVHGALDEGQRRALAAMLRCGPHGRAQGWR